MSSHFQSSETVESTDRPVSLDSRVADLERALGLVATPPLPVPPPPPTRPPTAAEHAANLEAATAQYLGGLRIVSVPAPAPTPAGQLAPIPGLLVAVLDDEGGSHMLRLVAGTEYLPGHVADQIERTAARTFGLEVERITPTTPSTGDPS